MPVDLAVARAHYVRQQTLARNVADAIQQLWERVDVADIVGSWNAVSERAVQVVAVGQFAAASAAIAYIGESVQAQDADPAPLGAIDPRALTGTAADGGDLATLIAGGAYRSRELLVAGAPAGEAMASGLARVLRASVNEVVQAGTSAATARIGVTPTVTGYTRVLTPPSCDRCILLAGKHFAHNAGFARHPRCDCTHQPYTVGNRPEVVSPEDAFAALSEAEQDAVFTRASAEAIRAGADMGRVVNARQSTYIPTGRRTPRGTPTRRTVEDLLAMAGTDRNRFLALLDSAGYLI